MSKKNKKSSAAKSSLFESVYVPSYNPDDIDLLRKFDTTATKTVAEIQAEVEEKLEQAKSFLGTLPNLDGTDFFEPRPLTPRESESLAVDKARMLSDVDEIRGMISEAKDLFDTQLNSESNKTFTYYFKRKPKLRKAVKLVAGKAENKITYETYVKALAIKQVLEKEDTASFFEEDEKE